MTRGKSRLSRKDLKFIAQAIGAELIPLMKAEDILQGLSTRKRQKLLSLLKKELVFAEITVEELLNHMRSEQRKQLFAFVLRQGAAGLTDENAKGND
ncbi:MAG: hypothetical protein R3E79_34870 [Caldilineaceae bacterium]